MSGNPRPTPAFGIGPIAELRAEFRDHAKSDEQALRDVRAEIGAVREDVKGLIRDTSAQTVMLGDIRASLGRRAATEQQEQTETARYHRSIRFTWWKAAIGVFAAGATTALGALLHHWLS